MPPPDRPRASPYVGPAILTAEQRRAMERALAREGFFDRGTAGPSGVEPRLLLPVWSPPAESHGVEVERVATVPVRVDAPIEPLPVWIPPSFPPRVERRCPTCGEHLAIDRIDLTANASWLSCRRCGRRWGGSIEAAEARIRPTRVLNQREV
jgi:hypothetical protein